MFVDFKDAVKRSTVRPLQLESFETFQVNLGNRCNQRCRHCHVGAGPEGNKIMPRSVMQKIADFLLKHPSLTIDVTGGCPELNPDFKFFIENAHRLCARLMVRTNLTVFFEDGLEWLADWYGKNRVVLIGSLPCYTKENVDKQRGRNVFEKSIKAIQMLNRLGYGIDQNLQLNLVYNPGGDFLPGSQQQLETDYKRQLLKNFGVRFSKLFIIVNAPIGRFKRYLEANGTLEKYMELLYNNFNPEAAEGIMCRSLISVDYRGILYNCDFNQALDLPLRDKWGRPLSIVDMDSILAGGFEIITGPHCYCCTAGAGSSCTGATVK
ncbi:MAG: radical SAM protein [Planctomycetes bacterium GWF2_50_10]|nr:MAG: radical SAM protein [Planctomycetes bacterium GWF2_50_10]